VTKKSTATGRTLYACRNHVVPFFLLLTSGIHSPQLPHNPSQISALPSIRLVSLGGSNARPVAALTPCVKLLSYQNAEFFSTSHRPGLQIPHHPSRLLPCPRTHFGVYKSLSKRNSCSWGIKSVSSGFMSLAGGALGSSRRGPKRSGGSEKLAYGSKHRPPASTLLWRVRNVPGGKRLIELGIASLSTFDGSKKDRG
jgi:hypothetical protein